MRDVDPARRHFRGIAGLAMAARGVLALDADADAAGPALHQARAARLEGLERAELSNRTRPRSLR